MRFLILFAIGFLSLAGCAHAARIVVTIEGVRSSEGDVYCALFSRPDGFPDGDYSDRHLKVKATTKPITVVFDNLPPGRYAVGCYHDENNSGHFDTTFFGYPVEGYALSNGVRAIFSRPTFADASFGLQKGEDHIFLHVKY